MKFAYKNLYTSLASLFILLIVLLPGVLFAQDPAGNLGTDPTNTTPSTPTATVTINNPLGIDNLNGFIKILLEGVIKIGIPLIAIALVYSGYLFVTAAGNPQKIEKAKDAFVYALIGGAILLGSWAIAQMISDTVLQIN